MSPLKCLCILVYLYLQIICASCDEGRSLAFVIEDSLSMSSDISTVRAEAKSFVNLIFFTNQNKIKNLVLIAFNKGVRSLAKTESQNNFIQSINHLSPNNRRNLDCPVKSLAGIEKALESSGPESFIYVFTDANAKDYTDLSNVTALCQEKQSQVVIIRTKELDCYHPNEIGNKVYYDVAKSCSGQVFDIEKYEIKLVMKTLRYLLQNKNTVFKWVTIPRSNEYVSVMFTLSDKDTYALISASGANVELRITTNNDFNGQQPYHMKLFWKKNNKVSYLMRKGPGTFYAWVKGDSAVTVVVYGRSHFSFKHGFSVIEPKSITNTNKQPTAGLKHHLIIKVNDLVPLVNIKEAQILDIANNGKIINHLLLTNIGRDVYVTESFVSPNKTFGIAVKGESQTTGNEIIIMAKTNIDPLNNIGVSGMPTNRNITLNVAKGAKIELNCMIVRLSPNTNVVWFKKNANNFIRITHARSKVLRINGALFSHAGQYKCQATDEKGTDTATFDVTVTGMPEISVDETKKNIPYDSDAELTCTVESNAPVNIIWKNEKGAILENPMVSLTVSKFYNRLHLRKVRESAVYTCLASNNIGHSRKDVSIVVDEGIPQIQASNRNVNVKKGAKAELDCKVTRGSPKTRVTWFKKRNNNFEQLANAKSEVLKISKAMFEHGGQYKCQAINGKGTASAIFDVTVHGLPEVIVGESTKNISYGSDVELMCVVKSNAPLTIIWKNERGTVLENKVSQITESEFHNRLNVKNMRNNAVYTCKASNNIGSSTKKVSIIVPLLFEVKKHIEGDLSINYGGQQTLQCHITSTKPMTIRWYRQEIGIKASRSLITTSKKYTISNDGSELIINNMDTSMTGEYTCEASLLSKPDEKISYSVNIKIVGLARPEIETTNKILNVTKGSKIELNCQVIRGTPKPVINWYMKNGTSLVPLNIITEVLTVNAAQLTDAGEYKCEATNELGTAAETFAVIVSATPEISITETKIQVPYDGEIELTCNVRSYPSPKIEWQNKDSVVLQNQVSKVSEYTYYNKYKAQNLRKSAVYVCVASNDVGISNKSVDITVLSPFEVKTHVQGVTGITYGTRRTLQCDIKSTKPMRILWYRQKVGANERSVISTSEKYTISDNGSELTINFMETNMAGKYTCEGSLLSNPSQKISYSVDVNIIGLGRPELQAVNKHVNVTKGGTIQLRCRIIRGTPQPVINWYKNNGTTLMPLNTKSEVLTVNTAQLIDAGEYKCEATNELGTAAETFDVVVSAAPEIFIDEIAKVVPYDSQVELTCNVESYVQPLIVWKNENGIILENKVTKTSAYLYSSQLKVQNIRKSTFYDCVASNNVGSITRVVNITVASPFEVIKHVQGDIGVAFGKKQILQCDIKSKKPITIRWYRQTNAVKTTRKLLIRPTNTLYSISGDGSMLTINSMATNMAGEYTCEASLLADPSEKISYNVKVNIVGLVRPEIQATNKNVYATKGNKVELNCRIIRGTPTPVINWYKKNGTNLMPLNTKTEVLTVNAAQLTDAGEYKCEATNELGTAAETFGVTISAAPEISIVETTRKVPYDGEVELTCNVESYPPPRIEWKNKDGVVLQNQVSKVSEYTYYNKYKAQNLRKSSVYVCVASNDVGISNKTVDITVLSPFEVKTHVQGVTEITYGTRRTLQCDIKSTKPMRILWYRQKVGANERSVISTSEKYTISDNGSELTINFMETNMAGKYTCEGSLLSNPSQKISYSVDVNIIGLGRPELQAVNKHVNVTKGGTIQLRCRIIRGTPQPVINWYMKNGTTLMPLNTKTEVLTVNAAQLTDAGEYKCEATNELGSAAETFDVVVSAAPEIFIDEIAKVVPYDSQVELTCNVESYVQPLIVWKNENGIILENKVTKTSAYLYSSQLKVQNIRKSTFYDCVASNNVGSISRVVNITVVSPFEVIKHIQGDIGVAFGKKQILQCDIKSKKPITIRWYRQTNAVKTTRKILIRPTNILYSISGDGSMLTINSMATNMAGEYTCETSLLADPSEKISYNVKVNIVGLVRPEIQATNKNVYATKGNKVELNCRIIRGTPTPVINWYRKNGTNLMPLNTKTEVLTVNAAQLTDTGEYKCEATNELGTAAETFDVTISAAPEISIVETTGKVPYDGEVELTCNVESYPPPRIEWKNKDGVVLQNQVSKVSEYTYYNKYKAQNLRKSAVYVCVASNDVGISNKTVDITVLSPFEVKTHVQGVTEITYGTRRTLQCDIKSTKPMRILWYRQKVGANEKSVISSSEKYSVSENGSELTINFMKTNMAGKYTCEGSLLSNPSQKISYSVDVNIIGLGRPELQVVNKHVNLTKGGTIQLSCRIIRGTPQPVINWYKKNGTTLMPLNTKSEVLTVNAAQLTDAGEYKCEATNELGTAAETFDVIVRAAPEISLAETTKIVPYDSEVELTCNVDSYVTPMIVWKNEKGLILETKFTKTSEYVYSSRLKVSNIKKSTLLDCVASNNVGSTSKDVNITVASPFEVKNHVQGIVQIEYGRKQILQCDIKSVKPITIRWYRLNNAVKTTTKSLIRSSNKYSISDDGSVLTINSMATNMVGEYTCEASLLTDPTEKISYSVNVNILGLERPKIQTTNKTVQATKGNKIQLNCRIIRGTPKPEIKWYKNNGTKLILLDTKAEVLTVNIAQLTDSGEYKCEASNELGTAAETFDVVVSAAPIISLEKTRRVPYDSEVELTCNVESYPSPRIEWKNIDGVVLQDQVSRASQYYYYNRYKITNVRKNVVYTCVASNNVGSTSKYVEINVLSPFEVKTYIRGVTKITYGDKHTLQCDIKSTKPMRIRWYRQEIGVKTGRLVISSSEKYTVSNDGTELTINSMDTKMSGLYTCEASLLTIPTEKVTYSTQVDVAGLASPHGFFSSEESTNSYKAICRYQGVPTPIISWQFKPKGSEKFKDLAITGEQLDITPLKSDNSGIYKCIATNIAGETEHEFAVTVQERPKILTEGTTHYGVEGDLVLKIPCNVTGVPEPTVMWKIDNKPINIGTKFVVKGTNLYINKPVRYDSAEYKCEATNKLGNDIKSFSVEIADSFENNEFLTGDTHAIYAEMDKPKAIQCNLTNKGESSVRWYMNGMLTKQVGSIYRIERVSSIDSKNYTCRVNTDEGSKSETFALEAGYPPSFEDNTPSPVNVNWTNTRQKMDCAAVALPNPKYEWRLNGKLLESSTNLKEKEITYWGEYTCEVSNVLGKINKKFMVTSTGCYINKNIAPQIQPLAYKKDIQTMDSKNIENNEIVLAKDKEIKLLCPSSPKSENAFKIITNKKEIVAKCIKQDEFIVDKKRYKYSELQCNTKIEPSVIHTREQCAGTNSELLRVGYKINGFLDAYRVCYDVTQRTPLYANVPASISKGYDKLDTKQFEWTPLSALNNTDTENENTEGNCECCYIKNQLVKASDLPFNTDQSETSVDNLNSIRVWNPNGCDDDNDRLSWEKFDEISRQIAAEQKWPYWTGASEYVDKDGKKVPRYLWRVFKTMKGLSVSIYVNDYTNLASDSDVQCVNKCDSITPTDQFLYCCSPDEFSRNFGVPLDRFK